MPNNLVDKAFQRLRKELDIGGDFPRKVLDEVEESAVVRQPRAGPDRIDRLDIDFVTVDPPGSRDLDQAVHAERRDGGFLLHYAIADVGFWVDRGSLIEEEAWRRGVTFYSPDGRDPLYPPSLSTGVASLLPGQVCPAILFSFELNERTELGSWTVERALVRSRQQLTYAQLLEGARSYFARNAGDREPWTETLPLLEEIGNGRIALEVERGGVSLPIRSQEVQQEAAAELGYAVVYESSSAAEKWNEQISLLTGHAAATRMLEAGVGVLRTMPPMAEESGEKLRGIARTLGFDWDSKTPYADFIHGLDPEHPRIQVLVRQARRVIRGADYVFFQGDPPEQPLHAALAFPYAHVTAPLRRLGDRYVLDLLVSLSEGSGPTPAEVAKLEGVPAVMNAADTKSGRLERRVIDIAEAAALSARVGEVFDAVVVDARGNELEFQVDTPPVRATVKRTAKHRAWPALGERVQIRVVKANVIEGRSTFEIA